MTAIDWTLRRPGVELGADTRQWVADIKAAHDDNAMEMPEFVQLMRRFERYALALPEPERIEACAQVVEHVQPVVTGMTGRVLGFGHER